MKQTYTLVALSVEQFNKEVKLFNEANKVFATQTHVGFNVSGKPESYVAVLFYEDGK